MEWAVRYTFKAFVASVVGLGLLSSLPNAHADRFNTETSSSTEFLGKGNAALSDGRGPYAMFYNPANLASKETKTVIQPVNFQLEGNTGLVGQGLSSVTSSTLSGLYSTLKTNQNDFVSSKYSVYPNLTTRYFSFGMLYEKQQGAMVRATDNALVVKARDRFAPSAASSIRLLSGILRLGVSVQLLTVGNADKAYTVPVNTSALSYAAATSSGLGISKNFGATVTLPVRYLPSFSLVGRDLGNTTFSGAGLIPFGTGGKPDTQKMSFDLGASLTVYLARRIEFKGALDYKDATMTLGGSPLQRMFAGGEMVFFDLVHLRGGLMHGYFTGGFGFDTRKTSVDIAVYSEELGSALRGSADQRFVLQYTWGIF